MSSSSRRRARPITVSLINDYEIIVHGLAGMLKPFSDRLEIVELEVGGVGDERADIALFDTFGGRRHALSRSEKMIEAGRVDHVVLYTWDASAEFLAEAERIGISGVLLKSESAAALVDSLERIVDGERLGLEHVVRGQRSESARDLTPREREVLALLAVGLSNREIADELYLSSETVKTYVKRIFGKLEVSNRVQAAGRAGAFALQAPESRLRP